MAKAAVAEAAAPAGAEAAAAKEATGTAAETAAAPAAAEAETAAEAAAAAEARAAGAKVISTGLGIESLIRLHTQQFQCFNKSACHVNHRRSLTKKDR